MKKKNIVFIIIGIILVAVIAVVCFLSISKLAGTERTTYEESIQDTPADMH